ncbi:MAG: hypothetical protein R3B96_18440 [Pirellulaceae bacterium]
MARILVARYDNTTLPLALSLVAPMFRPHQNASRFPIEQWLAPAASPVFREINRPVELSEFNLYRASVAGSGRWAARMSLYSSDAAAHLAEIQQLAQLVEYGRLDADAFRAAVDEGLVSGLIEQLGSTEFDRREQATTRLALIARQISGRLRQVAGTTDDLEVQYRVESILEGLAERDRLLRESQPERNPWSAIAGDFEFHVGAEERQGVSLDVLAVEIADPSATNDDWLVAFFGDDWNRWRIRADGERLDLFVGSDIAWLESQLAPGSEDSSPTPSRDHFERRAMSPRWADLEFSVSDWNSDATPRHAERTHIGVSFGESSIRTDIYVPTKEISSAATLFAPGF